jgi:hypothetical protein
MAIEAPRTTRSLLDLPLCPWQHQTKGAEHSTLVVTMLVVKLG